MVEDGLKFLALVVLAVLVSLAAVAIVGVAYANGGPLQPGGF